MLATQAALLSAVVTILAIILYMTMGFRVGVMRGKHKIDAPAMTGHPELERAVRVQSNTLEAFPVFLPALWLATIYCDVLGIVPAALGLLWVIGRFLYMQAYISNPAKRGPGFGICVLALLALMILTIVGIARAWSIS